jgi:hypothetical protein
MSGVDHLVTVPLEDRTTEVRVTAEIQFARQFMSRREVPNNRWITASDGNLKGRSAHASRKAVTPR